MIDGEEDRPAAEPVPLNVTAPDSPEVVEPAVVTDELPPIGGEPAPRKRGRPRTRNKAKGAKEKKAAVKAKRDRRAALDRQLELVADKSQAAAKVATDADAGTPAPAPSVNGAPVAEGSGAPAPALVNDDALKGLIGGTFAGIARKLPPKWGGGELTKDERELLGLGWVEVLKPYLAGPEGPWTVAIGVTVQCFALRAMAADAGAVVEPVHTPAPAASPAKVAPMAGVAVGRDVKAAPKRGARGPVVAGVAGAQFDAPDT